MKTVALGIMIEQIDGMRDTKELNSWENGFVADIYEKYLLTKKDTRNLSSKQVEVVARIWRKHFAG